MKKKTVTVFGGSGFLAKYIVSQLIKEGHKVNAICRNPHLNTELRLLGPIESLDIFKGNILQQSSIERYFEGADVVINLVGILFETRAQPIRAMSFYHSKHSAFILLYHAIPAS